MSVFFYTHMKHTTILISGLSGAGKSTIATMLGEKLWLRVIHPSSILKSLLLHETPDMHSSASGTGFWESPEGIQLFKDRLQEEMPMDLVCDDILRIELDKGHIVMDSWSMPWLYTKSYKIYLHADLETRIERVALRSNVSIKAAKEAILMKDTETRKLYMKHKNFDIQQDLEVFNLVIDTTNLSKKAVLESIILHLKE